MKKIFSLLDEFQKDPEAFKWRQIKEARKLKKAGFPIEFPLGQKALENKGLNLETNSYYHTQLETNSDKLKEAKDELEDLDKRHSHYVASEKEGLSEKHFALRDKIQARLISLKSRFEELKKYMSH